MRGKWGRRRVGNALLVSGVTCGKVVLGRVEGGSCRRGDPSQHKQSQRKGRKKYPRILSRGDGLWFWKGEKACGSR